MTIWPALGILALICIVISFYIKGSTFIWRGLQVGVIMATVSAIIMQQAQVKVASHDPINSAISKKIIVVCVLVGGIIELSRQLNKRHLNKKSQWIT